MVGRASWTGLVVSTLLITAAVGLAPPAAAAPAEAAPSDCAAQASAEGLSLVRSLELPTVGAGWSGNGPTYDVDHGDPGPVDRVGYCLELGDGEQRHWVWASHQATGEASDARLPTGADELTRRHAIDLTVRSDVATVPQVDGGQGWLEMWPNAYGPVASRQVPAPYDGDTFTADADFDADDNPQAAAYGSFQVHPIVDGQATTALAVNRWAVTGAPLEVGIGPAATGSSDWTGAQNAGDFARRTLGFYARAAPIAIDSAPEPLQLVPRATRQDRTAPTTVSGRILAPEVTGVTVEQVRAGRSVEQRAAVSDGSFAVTIGLPVALVETEVRVWAETTAGRRLVRRIPGVVAGDAFVVQGQSNAVARRFDATARTAESRWVRSYGSGSDVPAVSLAEDAWGLAVADTGLSLGSTGQWATLMGSELAARTGVPVAIVNGAHGGQPVSFFQRSTTDPTDPTTNYGRLLTRLRAAGLADHVAGVFWNQGENEADRVDVHVPGVRRLFADLRADLADGVEEPRFHLMQVRRSPCGQPGRTALRDAQRRLARELDAVPISLNGMDSAIGCHWDFPGGYERLGGWAFRVTATSVYGEPGIGVAAPDVTGARLAGTRTIVLGLRERTGLRIDAGAASGFRVADGTVTVTAVRQTGRGLELTTATPVPTGSTVEYVGHAAAGPWVTNRIGMGLLTFVEPIR